MPESFWPLRLLDDADLWDFPIFMARPVIKLADKLLLPTVGNSIWGDFRSSGWCFFVVW